jgi:hypothetical protein
MTCPSIAKREAELRAFHNSFPSRTRAVMRYVDELIDEWRRNPPPPPRSPPLNDAEDYTLEQYLGETFRNGLRSPGE